MKILWKIIEFLPISGIKVVLVWVFFLNLISGMDPLFTSYFCVFYVVGISVVAEKLITSTVFSLSSHFYE